MEQNKCNKCGRPMVYATEPKCNYCDACMHEYCGCKLGRIKEIEPTCDSTAVIPSVTVESVEGITNLANCLVHVEDINTTFYIDDKHRVMITWAGPVDIPDYDMKNNPNGYRDQIVTDIEKGIAVIYDKDGKGYTFGIYDSLDSDGAVTQAVNNKLDEMAADGTLEDIIAEYIGEPIYGFDTVTDMKASTTLKAGDRARTLGFHTIDDGGGATYRISDTGTANEMNVIAVGDLYANLVTPTIATPEMFGAYGDNTHDDKASIQKAIDIASNIMFKSSATYLVSGAFTLKSNLLLNGNGCKIRGSAGGIWLFSGNSINNVEVCGFDIGNVQRGSAITNSSNINIHDMKISTTEWGLLLSLVEDFRVENITFNQVRTSSYSNKDGVHINGGEHGVIRNIYGTTDDDMVALNADEPSQTYGPITDVVVEHVVTKNSQEYGATDSAYSGIKLMSRTNLIDNITIINCDISVDYTEGIILTSNSDGAGNIGRIYVNNCVFKKNHNRAASIINAEIGYKEFTIENTKLIYNSTGNGSFYNEVAGATSGKLTLNNLTLVDNSGTARAYFAIRHTMDVVNIDNIYSKTDNDYTFIALRGNIGEVNANNLKSEHAQYMIRITSDGTVGTLNLKNVSCKTSTALLEISGYLSRLNIAGMNTEATTYPISISKDQNGLVITGNDFNISSVRTLDVGAHTGNIRLNGDIVTNFTPDTASVGDKFIYSTATTAGGGSTYKYYTGGAWTSIQVA